MFILTVCSRSSDPFYVVTYNIKGVTTSWTFIIMYTSEKLCIVINPRVTKILLITVIIYAIVLLLQS